MSSKSVELVISEFTKSIRSMENRIISLEKIVTDQNQLIKKLIRHNEDSCVSVVQRKITEDVGKSVAKTAQRPQREARLRATTAISAIVHKKGQGNASPAAVRSGLSEPMPIASSSASAPSTPCASPFTQLDLVNKPARAVNQTQHDERNVNDGEWVEVKNRRLSRAPNNVTRGIAVPGSTVCPLMAAERKSFLHLYYLQAGTTAEQVTAHLLRICPNDTCCAESLKPRGDYASFKLTVPTKNVDIYLKPEHWAEDVHIKPWSNRFRKPQQQEST